MSSRWTRVWASLFLLFLLCLLVLPSVLPGRAVRRVAADDVEERADSWSMMGDEGLEEMEDNDEDWEKGEDAVAEDSKNTAKNVSSCTSKDASVLLSISGKAINRLTSAIAPRLGDALDSFVVPPQEIPYGKVDEIFIHSFFVESIRTQLAKPSPNEITIFLKGLSFVIDDSNFTVSSGVSCSGVFWGTIDRADVRISITLFHGEAEGEMRVNVTNTTLSWGESKLRHKVFGRMCRMAEGVIATFMGDLNQYLMKRIEEQLPQELPSLLEGQLKSVLKLFPISYASGPFLTKDVFTLAFQLVPASTLPTFPPPPPPFQYRKEVEALAREGDVGIIVPAASVQHRLDLLSCWGRLDYKGILPSQWNSKLFTKVLPELTELCPDCPLEIEIHTLKPWRIEFNSESLDVIGDGIEIGLYMFSRKATEAAAVHDLILSDVAELPLGRVWLTEEFSEYTPTAEHTRIPIGKIRFFGKLSLEDIWALNPKTSSKIFFKSLPMDDVSMEMLEMNIKGMNEEEVHKGLVYMLNYISVGLLHKKSPMVLPDYMVDTELLLNADFASMKFNVVVSRFLDAVGTDEEGEEEEGNENETHAGDGDEGDL